MSTDMASTWGAMGSVASLLYWSMLAACTVGPGTVVICARSGVEYQRLRRDKEASRVVINI